MWRQKIKWWCPILRNERLRTIFLAEIPKQIDIPQHIKTFTMSSQTVNLPLSSSCNNINQSMMTRTPLLQDDAPSFNQAKMSSFPDPCSFRNMEAMMQRSDTNKYFKQAQGPQASIASTPLLGLHVWIHSSKLLA